MNIFANVDAEKTNSVSDAPTLISRYTDKLHKRKIKINDMSLSVYLLIKVGASLTLFVFSASTFAKIFIPDAL